MKTTTLKIEGMNCDACAGRIKALAEKLPGVRMADVSFEQGEARVLHDPRTADEDRLVTLVENAGFRIVGRN